MKLLVQAGPSGHMPAPPKKQFLISSMFWPLVMTKAPERYTLPVGMLFFDSTQGQQTNYLMVAVTLSVIPMILIFVFLQKRLVKGIMMGGVKG